MKEMKIDESWEVRMMRTMAWERAKGELRSMLHTYINNDNYHLFKTLLLKFIDDIEGQGLQE